MLYYIFFVFFFKQKTAYEMRISDWSSDVCSSDLDGHPRQHEIQIFGRALPRTNARNEAAVLLQIVRSLLRIEDDGGVKEAEKDDPERIEPHIQRRTMLTRRGDRDHRVAPAAFAARILSPELTDGQRHPSSEERRVGNEWVSKCKT